MDTVSFEEKIEIRHLTISKKVEINRYNLDFLQVCRQNWAATSLQFATTQEKPVTYSFVNPSGMFIWQKDLLFTEKKNNTPAVDTRQLVVLVLQVSFIDSLKTPVRVILPAIQNLRLLSADILLGSDTDLGCILLYIYLRSHFTSDKNRAHAVSAILSNLSENDKDHCCSVPKDYQEDRISQNSKQKMF
jgi:hypothetical protein